MKPLLTTLACATALALLSSTSYAATPHQTTGSKVAAKNVIFMIGDGMGPAYLSAYRYYKDDASTKQVEPTIFDQLWVGVATTYPDDHTVVTDSAAAATALSTHTKSYNGAIGIDPHQVPQRTLMELAREHGWVTGAVATVQVNHATPASFFTHHPSRNMYNEIADSYATQVAHGGWSFDVLLGGGYDYFHRDDKNWLPELEQQGLQVVTRMDDLAQYTQTPVMGLFAPKALPFAIDDKPGRLANMTTHALRLLTEQSTANGKPFALMVEGSMIDWCGHANDIACAVHEMADFAAAVQVVRDYIAEHPNTLLVITADHSTGGLTLGQGGEYAWHSDKVNAISQSIEGMATHLFDMPRQQWRAYVEEKLAFTLTSKQWKQLGEVKLDKELQGRDRLKPIHQVLVNIVSEHTRTGWTTGGHTAVDVPVMATGPGAEAFKGYIDNTDIAKALLKLVR